MTLVAGLDEVGYGAWAGNLVIVVAAFHRNRTKIAGVNDSKKLSRPTRERLAPVVVREAEWIGVGFASSATIDRVGLADAWQIAAHMALEDAPGLEKLIVDGTREVDGLQVEQHCTPKADIIYWQVSAASIVAKVMRDQEMSELAEHYDCYDWASNVGYGTERHRIGLLENGPCPHHRMSFIKKVLQPPKNQLSRFK